MWRFKYRQLQSKIQNLPKFLHLQQHVSKAYQKLLKSMFNSPIFSREKFEETFNTLYI